MSCSDEHNNTINSHWPNLLPITFTCFNEQECRGTSPAFYKAEVRDNMLYVDNKLYAKVNSFDEESGKMNISLISNNQYLDGQEVTALLF